jgi:phage I-like protein
VRVSYSTAI